jgi:hypothetical protein
LERIASRQQIALTALARMVQLVPQNARAGGHVSLSKDQALRQLENRARRLFLRHISAILRASRARGCNAVSMRGSVGAEPSDLELAGYHRVFVKVMRIAPPLL